MKRVVAVEPDQAATPTEVGRLLSEISIEELEALAIEVVREHRRRLQHAQDLFEALELKEQDHSDAPKLAQLRHDYRVATLNLHAQHQLVSLIVAALGYVPDVDASASPIVPPN